MNKCGDCTLCCKLLEVGDKPRNEWCEHCHQGCSIYESRPGPCRNFKCLYLTLNLKDGYRPDRCGVMLAPHKNDEWGEFVQAHEAYPDAVKNIYGLLKKITDRNIKVVIIPHGV